MAHITEMWYDASQLDVTMSDRCPEHRNAIINHGNIFASELTQALKAKITSVKQNNFEADKLRLVEL